MTLSITTLGIRIECHYAECHVSLIAMPSVVILNVDMPNAVMLSVVTPLEWALQDALLV